MLRLFVKSDESVPKEVVANDADSKGEVTLEEDDLYERCEAIGEQFLDEAFSQTKKKIESIVGNQETIIENQQTTITIKNQEKSGEVTLEEGDLYERSMAFEFGEQFLDEAFSQTKKQIERIVRNQETIIENQQTIIKNHETIDQKLEKLPHQVNAQVAAALPAALSIFYKE